MKDLSISLLCLLLLSLGFLSGLAVDRLPPLSVGVPFTSAKLSLPKSLKEKLRTAEASLVASEQAAKECRAVLSEQSRTLAQKASADEAALRRAREQLARLRSSGDRAAEAAQKLRATPISGDTDCERWESSWDAVRTALQAAGEGR